MVHCVWSAEVQTYKLGEELASNTAVSGTQDVDRRRVIRIELLHVHRYSLKVRQRLLQT